MVAELQLQDSASDVAYRWAERTFANRQERAGAVVPPQTGQFASWLQQMPARIAITSDGIGTKIEVAERMRQFGTLGYDLLAMVSDDLAANGAEPVAVTNILDVDTVDVGIIDALMAGLHAAAAECAVAVAGGEIAELGARIGGYGGGMHFNWCATAVGVFRDGWHPIDGRAIQVGDAVVALQSTSFRSNGFSALRRTLAKHFGPDWHLADLNGRTWGSWLLEPCRLYAPLVVALRDADFDLHGLSHITGGGIPSKFGRTLKATGLGACLDGLFAPTLAMATAQRLGEIADRDAYEFWNMGNGFLVTVPAQIAEEVAAFAHARGFAAQVAGTITAEKGIAIASASGTLHYGAG